MKHFREKSRENARYPKKSNIKAVVEGLHLPFPLTLPLPPVGVPPRVLPLLWHRYGYMKGAEHRAACSSRHRV